MALSKAEIQRRSNEKRGKVARSFFMDKDTAERIKQLAKENGIPQGELIARAIEAWQRLAR